MSCSIGGLGGGEPGGGTGGHKCVERNRGDAASSARHQGGGNAVAQRHTGERTEAGDRGKRHGLQAGAVATAQQQVAAAGRQDQTPVGEKRPCCQTGFAGSRTGDPTGTTVDAAENVAPQTEHENFGGVRGKDAEETSLVGRVKGREGPPPIGGSPQHPVFAGNDEGRPCISGGVEMPAVGIVEVIAPGRPGLAAVLAAQSKPVGAEDHQRAGVENGQGKERLVRSIGDQAAGDRHAVLPAARAGRLDREVRGAAAIHLHGPGFTAVAAPQDGPAMADGPAGAGVGETDRGEGDADRHRDLTPGAGTVIRDQNVTALTNRDQPITGPCHVEDHRAFGQGRRQGRPPQPFRQGSVTRGRGRPCQRHADQQRRQEQPGKKHVRLPVIGRCPTGGAV